jgi:hypothetical protein
MNSLVHGIAIVADAGWRANGSAQHGLRTGAVAERMRQDLTVALITSVIHENRMLVCVSSFAVTYRALSLQFV